MIVIKKLAAKLKVQLSAKFADALTDSLCLHADVHSIVKSDTHKILP